MRRRLRAAPGQQRPQRIDVFAQRQVPRNVGRLHCSRHAKPCFDEPEQLEAVVVALGVWVLASAAFAFYVANFGSFNATYGSIAGVIVFLVWLWITNLAILFGHQLNAELERHKELEEGRPGAEREIQLEPRSDPD